MSAHAKLPELSLTGNKKDNLRLWFNDYCVIKEYRDPSKTDHDEHYLPNKRALEIASFRSALSDETLNIVQYIIEPAISEDDKLKPWVWMQKLSMHIEGEDTVMSDRYEFHEKKQFSHESIAEWEARVRQTAAPLEYKEMSDQIMRDKFVFGLHSADLRGELLKLNHYKRWDTTRSRQGQSHS